MIICQRRLIDAEPFGVEDPAPFRWGSCDWPARWIHPAGVARGEPCVFAAALDLSLEQAVSLRLHVAGDQRWELLVDGERVARNAEASQLDHWAYASLDLDLPAGSHRLVARIWCAGEMAGVAQPTWQAGFLLASEGPLAQRFATGLAPWLVRRLTGYAFARPPQLILAAARLDADCAGIPSPWHGAGEGWEQPELGIPGQARFHTDVKPGPVLQRAQLPAQRERPIAWGRVRHADGRDGAFTAACSDAAMQAAAKTWLAGGRLGIGQGRQLRLLLDLGRVTCAYVELELRGGAGAELRVEAADALICTPPTGDPQRWWEAGKGRRDEIEGKWWWGGGDRWRLDGRAHCLDAPWWHAGRYLLIVITTAGEALELGQARLIETGYPLAPYGSASCSYPDWSDIKRLCWRSLQVNAHEHWMDCPTVERLQYLGDTRVMGLTALACSRDSALHRKAILDFDRSRDAHGLPSSRAPARWRQTIPAFSAPFVGLVHDHWLWRGEDVFVRARLPGVRAVLDRLLAERDGVGLLPGHPGWNFTDWCESWDRNSGIPPAGNRAVMGAYNWFAVLALGWAAELEEGLGEPELAALRRRQRARLAEALLVATWDDRRGRLRDAPDLDQASEHVQSLALLAGTLPAERSAQVLAALLGDGDLARCTVYFEHYLFSALAAHDRSDALLARWRRWADLPALGFTACPEMPEPSRSDCHGWGAHPLYHLRCSLAGIQPVAPGMATVRIRPRLGGLEHLAVDVPHPGGGEIRVECRGDRGCARLPAGVAGILDLPDRPGQAFTAEIAW
jgi:alpha-L-rhamnosidase